MQAPRKCGTPTRNFYAARIFCFSFAYYVKHIETILIIDHKKRLVILVFYSLLDMYGLIMFPSDKIDNPNNFKK